MFTRRFGFLNKNCCSTNDIEISTIQSHILYEIKNRYKPSMQEVAEALGTDITTFSRQIQTLIKMNLVEKKSHPEDRRVQILTLTESGVQVEENIDRQMNGYFTDIFQYMTEEEREMVISSLKVLNRAMANSKNCCKISPD